MTFEKDLDGKAAIVTGASRNLGRGFAEALARRGANVVVHWNAAGSRGDAEETAFRVKKAGAAAELVQADLADPEQVALLVERCLARFKRFDILINNAGVIIKKPFAEITDQDFERSFAINARSPFLLMRNAAVHMREEGRIIGRPEDVVPLVEYLLQPNATWMSGQTIFVNGGFVAR